MIVAVVPARGQSKRLPRKNVLLFMGHPLIAWSIRAALCSPSVAACVVTTDDPEIARVAEAYGAAAVERPAALATDAAPTVDAVRHAMEVWSARGNDWDAAMTLQPTNPLRPISMIENAIAEYRRSGCDSLVSINRENLKTGRFDGGVFAPAYVFGAQTHTVSPTHYENGLLYLTSRSLLMNAGRLSGDRILGYVTQKPYGDVDIDDALDFEIGARIGSAICGQLSYLDAKPLPL